MSLGLKSKAAGSPPLSFVVRRQRESRRPLVSKRLMKDCVLKGHRDRSPGPSGATPWVWRMKSNSSLGYYRVAPLGARPKQPLPWTAGCRCGENRTLSAAATQLGVSRHAHRPTFICQIFVCSAWARLTRTVPWAYVLPGVWSLRFHMLLAALESFRWLLSGVLLFCPVAAFCATTTVPNRHLCTEWIPS